MEIGIVCDDCDFICTNTYMDENGNNSCCECRGLKEKEFCSLCLEAEEIDYQYMND
jgi:hypothetical protein